MKIIVKQLAFAILVLANFVRDLIADEYLSIEQLWIEFKLKNGKTYASLEEEYTRLVFFCQNNCINIVYLSCFFYKI